MATPSPPNYVRSQAIALWCVTAFPAGCDFAKLPELLRKPDLAPVTA
jgi:hypothetical protein